MWVFVIVLSFDDLYYEWVCEFFDGEVLDGFVVDFDLCW